MLFFSFSTFAEVNLDFPLYKNEHYYNNSKEQELASFMDGANRVRIAQQKIAESESAGLSRVFHTKQHGCFVGKLNILNKRPMDSNKETFVGMFDPENKQSYDVLVRFSNGLGISQHDKLVDVRGMAIKVIDVKNSQTGQMQNVDLLMTNSPTPGGKDFLEFADFMDLVAEYGPTVGALFFFPHLRATWSLIKATGIPLIDNYSVKSMATQRYWSGHPYLLGTDKAMKFNVIPTETQEMSTAEIESMGSNAQSFLFHDLSSRIQDHSVRFTFALQLEKDPHLTPIEDNLDEWTEKASPSIDVAELVIEKQHDPHTGALHHACQEMRFTPAHYIPEHRPLSNMGRGRLFAYEASQKGRSQKAAKEPTSADLKFWRGLGTQSY